jgi:hypothetical protein
MNRFKTTSLMVSLLAPLVAAALSLVCPQIIFLLFILQGMPRDPRLTPIVALVFTIGDLLGLDFSTISSIVL